MEEVKFIFSMDDQFSKKAKQAEGQVKGLEAGLSRIKGMVAGAFSIGAVTSFGSAVIDSLKNYEYFHASLKTMLHGNANATQALETQLTNLAKTTPFELTQVQDATKQLLAYGFKAGDVVDTMRTLGDVSSGIGAPLGDIAYLYGTLKTSGRVTLMDLRQFAGRGIPIYETLAKRLKTTTDAISGMATNGKISFKDIEGAFKDMTTAGGQFFNLMEDQSKTVGGQLSNMGDAWEQLKVNIGKSQTGIIGGTVSFFNNMLNSLVDFTSATNRMESAYEKYGGKKRSGITTANSFLGMFTGDAAGTILKKQQMQDDEYLQKRFITNTKTKLQALQAEVELRKLLKTTYEAEKKGDISKDDLSRKQASIRSAIDEVKGLQDLYSMKDKPGTLNSEASIKSKAEKESSKVKQQQYTNINITIDKMIEDFTVKTETMEKGAQGAAIQVLKVLTTAINNSQIVAGQ